MGRGILPVSRRGWLWVAGCFVGSFDVLTILLDNFLGVGVCWCVLSFLRPICTLGKFHKRSVTSVAFSADGKWCGTVGGDNNHSVALWGSRNGQWNGECGWFWVVGGVLMFVVCCRFCVLTNFVMSSFFCRWQIDHHLSWRSWQHVFLKFCRGHQWKI